VDVWATIAPVQGSDLASVRPLWLKSLGLTKAENPLICQNAAGLKTWTAGVGVPHSRIPYGTHVPRER